MIKIAKFLVTVILISDILNIYSLEFIVDPNYKLPGPGSNAAYGIFNSHLYIVGGFAGNSIIRTPINKNSSNYGLWETTPIAITNNIVCSPNCGVIFENKHEMYVVGNLMNFGNGEQKDWDTKYKSYKIDLDTLSINETSWVGFTDVTAACTLSNAIDTIYVIGGLNRTGYPEETIQIYYINADTGLWIQKKIQFISIMGTCQYSPYDASIYVFPSMYTEPWDKYSVSNRYVRKLNVNKFIVNDITMEILNDTIIGSIDQFANSYPNIRYHSFSVYSHIDSKIYFGGGLVSGSPDIFYNDMYTVNVINNSFEYLSSNSHLNTPIASPAAVVMFGGTTIKIFGGITGQPAGAFRIDTVQYAIIPTLSPTEFPTATPSNFPTATPSNFPTATPSKFPTATPSKFPTATPSKFPTATPSKFPTATPSKFPTATPSKFPSISPTFSTSSPSVPPSFIPTLLPTTAPSTLITKTPTNIPSDGPIGDTVNKNGEWINKVDGENCGDGYTDLDPELLHFNIYCERCKDDEAGTNGKCFKCGTFEEPNHSRTECEFFHPWWLYLLETIAGLTCIGGIVVALYKILWNKNKPSLSTTIELGKSA